MNVFLATAKGDDPARVEGLKAELATQLPDATIVDGATDWRENFSRCGGWPGWVQDVAQGRTLGGRPRFDAIVCPQTAVGRATYQIVQRALETRKPVIYLRRDGVALRVIGIVCDDPDSWKAGWSLVIEPGTR
jgi:hypothetical protein